MKSPESFVALTTRLAIYTGGLLGAYALLPVMARNGDFTAFKEGGPIEWLQFGILAVTSCVFLAGSVIFREMRQWFVVLAMLSLTACIRECDSIFSNLLPYFGWQLPAFAVTCVSVITICRNPIQFVDQAKEAISRRGFGILWAGFMVVIAFAQLVGHGAFLEELMGADYVRTYKRVIEELGELFGYALLAIGGVESLLEASLALRARAPQAASPGKRVDGRAPATGAFGELSTVAFSGRSAGDAS